MVAPLDYYAQPGPITAPHDHAARLAELPKDLPDLVLAIQGLVLHRAWAPAYGVELPPDRLGDAQARTLPAILDRVLELDARPLNLARPLIDRFMGTCRDFALLLCAVLRSRGVPARARCGFGTYFTPGRYEDHWIVEHWSAKEARWISTDPQLDAFQLDALKADFDPLDLPAGHFWTAGRAWEACRKDAADAQQFGIFDMWGLWFIRGNVVRDLAALNKMELLPWDGWGMLEELGNDEWPDEVVGWLDRAAAVAEQPDAALDELRALYESSPGGRVAGSVFNWQTGVEEEVPS
jgi:hypothetical protein